MTYSFVCPIPCNHEIRVYAENEDDAAMELIRAGALRCRNASYRCRCEKIKHDMSPIPGENLKRIVRTCIREEREEQEDCNGIPASLHG